MKHVYHLEFSNGYESRGYRTVFEVIADNAQQAIKKAELKAAHDERLYAGWIVEELRRRGPAIL